MSCRCVAPALSAKATTFFYTFAYSLQLVDKVKACIHVRSYMQLNSFMSMSFLPRAALDCSRTWLT